MNIDLESSGGEWCWRNVLKSCLSSLLIISAFFIPCLVKKRRCANCLLFVTEAIYIFTLCCYLSHADEPIAVWYSSASFHFYFQVHNINVRTYQDFMAFCTCEPLKLHITFMDLWLLISWYLKWSIKHNLLL